MPHDHGLKLTFAASEVGVLFALGTPQTAFFDWTSFTSEPCPEPTEPVTPEPTDPTDPATPAPENDDKSESEVTELPTTGHGSGSTSAMFLLLATSAAALLAAGGLNLRKNRM